jgi:predicted nucleotidyltransferase
VTREERLEIAREVTRRIVEKYGERVTVVAAYGSVAKGEDTDHSDLDIWVATREPLEDVRFFVYRGMPISINWNTEEGHLKTAGRVTPEWPVTADEVHSFLVLYEQEGSDFLMRLKAAANALSDEEFAEAIRTFMVRTRETWGKIQGAWSAGDHYRLLVNGRWLVRSVAMILGLLNRRFYSGGRGFFQLSKEMPKQPRDYPRLLDLAGGFTTTESEVVYRAGEELWKNLGELVRAEGIEWESDTIPL